VLTLFSYPGLFGVADNNPYGLKVFAFLRLCGLAFRHEHILDASAAPRGQLPYLSDDAENIGDSDTIVAHLIRTRGLTIDNEITRRQHTLGLLLRRTLDDLYWVMSYSRWKDPRFWPLFRDALLREHPEISADALAAAQDYNFKRYHYQGIGRFEPDGAYARGIADLDALSGIMAERDFIFGERPTSADAGLYGFVANIFYYDIETPLKAFVIGRPNLVRHCRAIHERVSAKSA
jgi:glutathione S-transferase